MKRQQYLALSGYKKACPESQFLNAAYIGRNLFSCKLLYVSYPEKFLFDSHPTCGDFRSQNQYCISALGFCFGQYFGNIICRNICINEFKAICFLKHLVISIAEKPIDIALVKQHLDFGSWNLESCIRK